LPATSRHAGRRMNLDAPSAEGRAQDTLLYLYCVLEPSAGAEALLRSGSVEGLDPTKPVFPIAAEGVLAAVSHVPVADFGEQALNELVTDLPRLAPLVVRHENAVRVLFAAAPALVPMAFGAVYREPDGVVGFLTTEAGRLKSLFDLVRGKEEWGIKVFADPTRLRDAAARSSAPLRALDDEIQAAGPGKAYLLQRKRDEMLADAARSFLRDALHEIVDRLKAHSSAMRLEDIPGDQVGPTELVLKVAFLIEADAAQAFQSRVGEIAAALSAQGLAIELTGPWAPYSFTGARANGG
jgi:hypothetical protein